MKYTNKSKAMLYNINRIIKHVSNIQFDNFVTHSSNGSGGSSTPVQRTVIFYHSVLIPYTRVDRRIRLFPKLQGNMRLIVKGQKMTTPPKSRRLFGSTCTWQGTLQVKRTRKTENSVLTWCSPWNPQRVWAVVPWQTLVLVLMRTADVDEKPSRRDRRYCIVEIRYRWSRWVKSWHLGTVVNNLLRLTCP